jgi:tetratricopeptide (TPR) repeat protein
MMKALVLVVLGASLLTFSARGQTAGSLASERFAAGTQAFEARDYSRALSQFQAALDAGMTGPAVQYNIAVCHYKLEEYRQAEATFREIARDYPAMRELAQYNAGLALERQGRDADAQTFFQLAQQNAADDRLVRLAAAKAARSEQSQQVAPTWLTLFDFNVGHDSNVALLDESLLSVGQSADSPSTEIMAYAAGPLRAGSGMRLEASGYLVRYADAGEFDQDGIRLAGMYQWRTDAWRIDAGPFLYHSTLNGQGLDERFGVGLSLRRAITRDYTLGVRVTVEEIDSGADQYRYIAGSRNQVQFTIDRSGTAGRLTLGLVLESNDRHDPSMSPTRRRLWVRHNYVLNDFWTTDLSASFRASSYDELDPQRDEDLIEVTAALMRHLGRNWAFNVRYAWAKNDASVEPFEYDRSRLGIGLSKGF